MSNFLVGLFLGFMLGVVLVISTTGDALSFYSKYKAVGKDIDKLKQVIELEEK